METLMIIVCFIVFVYFMKQILESPDEKDNHYDIKTKILNKGYHTVIKKKAKRKPRKKYKRESIPTEVMIEVWERDRGRCVYCGSDERLEYDHIIPVSKGGANT